MPSSEHADVPTGGRAFVRVLPYGDRALLVELSTAAEVASFTAVLRQTAVMGVVELVPAARTVLVRYDPDVGSVESLRRVLATIDPGPVGSPSAVASSPVVIEVRYDGEDLAAVADECGLTVDEVVRRHQAPTYRSAFCGFAPGFAYLTGLDARLAVPRLATPRPRVAAGSVAIASEFAGVYPTAMPGGWRLLGHTDAVLWDLARAQPALLAPGTSVRFRSVDR